jgi:hypothetical protein
MAGGKYATVLRNIFRECLGAKTLDWRGFRRVLGEELSAENGVWGLDMRFCPENEGLRQSVMCSEAISAPARLAYSLMREFFIGPHYKSHLQLLIEWHFLCSHPLFLSSTTRGLVRRSLHRYVSSSQRPLSRYLFPSLFAKNSESATITTPADKGSPNLIQRLMG